MEKSKAGERIIVALDFDNLKTATDLVKNLNEHVWGFKLGLEFMTAFGAPRAVGVIQMFGGRIFFDGKFHDIEHTIEAASREVAKLGVEMFNVHASSGVFGMHAAKDGAYQGSSLIDISKKIPLVIGVTVLTSHSEDQCEQIFGTSCKEKVLQFAEMAVEAGIDGLVCSPQEVEMIRNNPNTSSLKLVTPGVRPEWASKNDQKRVMTPGEAVKAGADFLVIGRPISNPPEAIGSPYDATMRIIEDIEKAIA